MKTFIIAEVGINHNGDINIAKKLIDVAVNAKVDAVKFQKRNIDKVYSKEILDSLRDSPWGTTQRDQKNGIEFGLEEFNEINNYCKEKDIQWSASAWDLDSLDFLNQFNLPFNKVASPMIVDKEFLEEISKKNIYTYISTGMSNTNQIDEAVSIFIKNNCPFELMHCVSTYPMEPEHANLKTINALSNKYKCKVGYSGHENGIAISMAAVAMGASSLERHITLDRSMYGSDQSASLEASGLDQLVGGIRKIEQAVGQEMIGHVLDEEIPIAKKLRSHIK